MLNVPDAYSPRIGCVSLDGSRFEPGRDSAFARGSNRYDLVIAQDYVTLALGHFPSDSFHASHTSG